MKKREVFALTIIVLLGLIGFSSAELKLVNSSIINEYRFGETIAGNIIINFTNEPISGLFEGNFPGNKTLLSLMLLNEKIIGQDFNCTRFDCKSGYVSTGDISSVVIGRGERKTIGIKITGTNITSISSPKIILESNAQNSCSNQLVVEIYNKTFGAYGNQKNTDDICFTKNSGCFDDEAAGITEITLQDEFLCEKLTLPGAAAYKVGAKVKNTTSTNGQSNNLTMYILDNETKVIKGECKLPKNSVDVEELSCTIKMYSYSQREYFVCIKNAQNIGEYKLYKETESPTCGTYSTDSGSEGLGNSFNRDYSIFAQTMGFGAMKLELNDSVFAQTHDELTLSEFLMARIRDDYNYKCNPECIIPLNFFDSSGLGQSIELKSVSIKYEDEEESPTTVNKLASVSMQEPLMSSMKDLTVDISKIGLKIPSQTSQNKIELFYRGSRLIEDGINIRGTIASGGKFDISPKSLLVGINTILTINTTVNSSVWKFDRLTTTTSTGNKTTYRCTAPGQHDVEVRVTYRDGKIASANFTISCGNPKESVKNLIKIYQRRINGGATILSHYPAWIKAEIVKKVNYETLNQELKEKNDSFNAATDEAGYTQVMNDLLAMEVPSDILLNKRYIWPLAASENINIGYLKEISENTDKDLNEEDIKKAIYDFLLTNYDGTINSSIIAEELDSQTKEIFTHVKISIFPKADGENKKSYLIIDHTKTGLVFKENYDIKEVGNGEGIYFEVDAGQSKEIEFLIEGGIDAKSLGAYLSPVISDLEITKGGSGPPVCVGDDCKRGGGFVFNWLWFTIGAIVVLIVFLIIYIALQEWYKKNYEKHLFENPDDLYNVINFIYNSRTSGLKDEEINKKLSSAGWRSEQLRYAFKKIEGRRTGMWEIPIFKSKENKRVREEIARRQHGPVDVRFIKRPNL